MGVVCDVWSEGLSRGWAGASQLLFNGCSRVHATASGQEARPDWEWTSCGPSTFSARPCATSKWLSQDSHPGVSPRSAGGPSE